jgi:hypothetical protein
MSWLHNSGLYTVCVVLRLQWCVAASQQWVVHCVCCPSIAVVRCCFVTVGSARCVVPRLQWFNEVGRGGGSQRRFVLSAEDVIRQESIRDHGTFLELDQTLQFGGGQPQFILLSDEEIAATNEEDDKRLGEGEHTPSTWGTRASCGVLVLAWRSPHALVCVCVPAVGDTAAACVGGRTLLAGAGAGAGTGAAAGSSGGGGSASPSVHHVHGAVRGAPEPMVVLSDVGSVVAALDVVTVDKAGKECFPSRCKVSSPGHACHFTMKGWAASGKQGFTMQGPVSLRYRRYLCTTHSSIVSTKVSDRQYFDEATKPTPELIQLGKVSKDTLLVRGDWAPPPHCEA